MFHPGQLKCYWYFQEVGIELPEYCVVTVKAFDLCSCWEKGSVGELNKDWESSEFHLREMSRAQSFPLWKMPTSVTSCMSYFSKSKKIFLIFLKLWVCVRVEGEGGKEGLYKYDSKEGVVFMCVLSVALSLTSMKPLNNPSNWLPLILLSVSENSSEKWSLALAKIHFQCL